MNRARLRQWEIFESMCIFLGIFPIIIQKKKEHWLHGIHTWNMIFCHLLYLNRANKTKTLVRTPTEGIEKIIEQTLGTKWSKNEYCYYLQNAFPSKHYDLHYILLRPYTWPRYFQIILTATLARHRLSFRLTKVTSNRWHYCGSSHSILRLPQSLVAEVVHGSMETMKLNIPQRS